MNVIKLLLLLATSAQVEAGTERDFGWAYKDGVLEYIVQISPDEARLMAERSVALPKGQENVSDMPPELIGRVSRFVTRIGTEVLPREPSLQELERTPRLFEQPNANATALLGPGQMRDFESDVHNIQGQGTTPLYPALPNGPAGGQIGSMSDQVGQAANTLRDDVKESLSQGLPDLSTLAQTFNNQSSASSFLNDTRGGGSTSKFNSTALPANPGANPANAPAKIPEFPPATGSNLPFSSANQAAVNNRNSTIGSGLGTGLGSGMGTGKAAPPLYPADRLSPPSLSNQMTLPQQQTPSQGFGTTPGLAASQPSSDWKTSPLPSYAPSMSQPSDNFAGSPNYAPNYTSLPNQVTNQDPTRISMNTNQARLPPAGGAVSQPTNEWDKILLTLDKNKDRQLTPDEYTPTNSNADGILLTFFVLSLLVNLFLAHLIRKLLVRYRLVLTNVRNQAAYT
jgi:hypothetical protein